VGNVAEGGPLATVWDHLPTLRKKEKWKCIRIWISILKPQITRKQSRKLWKTHKKQKST